MEAGVVVEVEGREDVVVHVPSDGRVQDLVRAVDTWWGRPGELAVALAGEELRDPAAALQDVGIEDGTRVAAAIPPRVIAQERLAAAGVPVTAAEASAASARQDWATLILLIDTEAVAMKPEYLFKAATAGAVEATQRLLDAGVDPNHVVQGDSVLCAAVRAERGAVVEVLAHSEAVDREKKNVRGKTPLMLAVGLHKLDMVRQLLAAGAAVNTGPGAASALCCAVSMGAGSGDAAAESVAVLVEHGAEVNFAGRHATTPLMLAAKGGYRKCAYSLLEAGADVNARDLSGMTALSWTVASARSDAPAALESYIAHGADVCASDEDGDTALMYAARKGRAGMAAYLIAHGADLAAVNHRGWTALHYAALGGHLSTLHTLLAAAPPRAACMAAYNVASERGVEAVSLLRRHLVTAHSVPPVALHRNPAVFGARGTEVRHPYIAVLHSLALSGAHSLALLLKTGAAPPSRRLS
eukprot:TRINITY_DN20662_c0_g1_i1.p1 TRINITY_DN20662_c0_g1~~TRINITY_DN20662_c0_g1_i1.p1  ORF type:complete len:470 (+),score=108.55 TRINITY_DN20662_c0_g1_i1:991-2400(+)